MDYDFSNLCADQLESLIKKLDSLRKGNLKEYKMALNVINNQEALEHIEEMNVEIDDIFADAHREISISYMKALNQVQGKLAKYL